MEFAGKIVVVTGGACGIGRALSQAASDHGAKAIIVADHDVSKARQTAAAIGGRAVAVDVGNQESVAALVDNVENDIGPIDIYCSNAGLSFPNLEDVDTAEISDHIWQQSWNINVMSHVYAARIVIPRMKLRGQGAFAVTVSAAGLLNQIGNAPYGTSKYAALGFAENLAISHGDEGIYVAAICPQGVRTDMIAGMENGPVAVDGILSPEDVAEEVIKGFEAEQFLILPHPQVKEQLKRKVENHEGWLHDMFMLKERLNRIVGLAG